MEPDGAPRAEVRGFERGAREWLWLRARTSVIHLGCLGTISSGYLVLLLTTHMPHAPYRAAEYACTFSLYTEYASLHFGKTVNTALYHLKKRVRRLYHLTLLCKSGKRKSALDRRRHVHVSRA